MKNLSLRRTIPALALGLLWAAAAPAIAAPTQFLSNGHYYDFVSASLTWNQASLAAQQQTYLGVAGHLATITSAAEDTFLYNQVILPHISPDVYHDVWLGGYQLPGSQEPGGGWVWVTGENWSYSHWKPGEPNNGAGYGFPAENVLAMSGTGGWNDEPADFALIPTAPAPVGYLLEFDVPEPATASLLAIGAAAFFVFRRRSQK